MARGQAGRAGSESLPVRRVGCGVEAGGIHTAAARVMHSPEDAVGRLLRQQQCDLSPEDEPQYDRLRSRRETGLPLCLLLLFDGLRLVNSRLRNGWSFFALVGEARTTLREVERTLMCGSLVWGQRLMRGNVHDAALYVPRRITDLTHAQVGCGTPAHVAAAEELSGLTGPRRSVQRISASV